MKIAIAKMLDAHSFDEPADPHTGKTLNVTQTWWPDWWAVRMRVGGAPRLLGLTTRFSDALRYADMANYYLIQQEARRPRKTGYNFSAAQAAADLENYPDIASLLGEALLDVFPNGELPKFKRKLRQDTLRDKLNKLEKRIELLEHRGEAL